MAAFREAKKLDPNDLDVRVMLSRLLAYGDDGIQYGHNARVAEAIEEYRAMMKDLGEEGRAYAGELLMALAQAGRSDEVRKLVDAADTSSSATSGGP